MFEKKNVYKLNVVFTGIFVMISIMHWNSHEIRAEIYSKKNATNVCRWKIIRINVSKLIDDLQTIDFMKFNEHNHQRCE